MRWVAALIVAALAALLAPLPAEAARKALVIGNAAYAVRPLANPVNDAADMAARLRALGFAVTLATNTTRAQMAAAVLAFRRQVAAGDEAVVFYAGHGMQVRGQNWLLPVDADPQEEAEVEFAAIGLEVILRGLAESGARTSLVLLDACRDNPFEGRFRGGTRGLARVEAAASGTLVSYAARPGTVAADGQGRNSPYTAAWLAALAEPGLTHHQILDRVHVAVKRTTGDRQETWQEGQMVGALVLNPASPAIPAGAAAAPAEAAPVPAFDPRLAKLRFWESAERGGTAADYDAYLAQYPRGQFAALAKARLAALRPAPPPVEVEARDAAMVTKATANVRAAPATDAEKLATLAAGAQVTVTGKAKGSDWLRIDQAGRAGWVHATLLAEPATAAAAAPVPSRPAGEDTTPGRRFRDCADCPEMIWLPPGEFVMGSPPGEPGRLDWEGPQRSVRIGYPLALGVHEVTFDQWEACVADGGCGGWRPDDEKMGRGNHPVVRVSRDDAEAYAEWLSRKTGAAYRLPSEAEWEYAARAGTTTTYPWGTSVDAGCTWANIGDAAAKDENPHWTGTAACRDGYMYTAPVGSFRANAFGLHDMVGNVSEWTADCWEGSYTGAPSDGAARQSDICGVKPLRGGSWYTGPPWMRVAVRTMGTRDERNLDVGFRVARTR